ncbi:MAG: hypothetical protein AB7P14_17955 [Blastocatellales bacterium]|jgi:hypothetical protein
MIALETWNASNVGALIVNRKTLVEARDKARSVSRGLHQIENISDLEWEELNALCRASQQTELLLQEMLSAGEEAISLAF